MVAKISVIVPVFNAEKYLEKCINSIIAQTLSDIEIILINDGSTDKSLCMIEKFAQKDNRIIYFTQENKGQSAARNLGITKATGDFIAFVDSDDYIAIDMLDMMYKNALETSSQISICGITVVNENGNTAPSNYEENRIVFNRHDAVAVMLSEKYILFAMCDKIYKRSLFDDKRFPVGVIHEDVLLPYELIKKCDNVCCQMIPKYFYMQNSLSTTGKPFTKARLNDIYAREQIVRDVKENFSGLYENAMSIKLVGYLNIIHKLFLDNNSEYDMLLKGLIAKVRQDRHDYLSCDFISQKRKIGVFLLSFFPAIYRFLYSKIAI